MIRDKDTQIEQLEEKNAQITALVREVEELKGKVERLNLQLRMNGFQA